MNDEPVFYILFNILLAYIWTATLKDEMKDDSPFRHARG